MRHRPCAPARADPMLAVLAAAVGAGCTRAGRGAPPAEQREFIAAAFGMKDEAVRAGDQAYGAVVVQGRPHRRLRPEPRGAEEGLDRACRARSDARGAGAAGNGPICPAASCIRPRGPARRASAPRPMPVSPACSTASEATDAGPPRTRADISMIDHVSIGCAISRRRTRFYEAVLGDARLRQARRRARRPSASARRYPELWLNRSPRHDAAAEPTTARTSACARLDAAMVDAFHAAALAAGGASRRRARPAAAARRGLLRGLHPRSRRQPDRGGDVSSSESGLSRLTSARRSRPSSLSLLPGCCARPPSASAGCPRPCPRPDS